MANKQLTASVKLNTTQFEAKLKRIARGIDALNNAVKKQQSADNAVNDALNNNIKSTDNLKRKTNEVAKSANAVHNNFKKSSGVIDLISKKLKKMAISYLGVMGAKVVIGASDTITKAQNKLDNLPGGSVVQTDITMDKVYAAAQRSRGSYSGMITNVSKSMMLAGEAFDGNIDNAIRFQEIMSKAYSIGGASAAEQSSSMYQMIQALGAGTLAGDELRSVREGAPLAYKAIEEFAQKVYGVRDSLKDMAADGLITSDIVVAGIMDAGDKMDETFKNTTMTFEQSWDMIKNAALRAFKPALEVLNRILTHPVTTRLAKVIGSILVFVANTIGIVLSTFELLLDLIESVISGTTTAGKIIRAVLLSIAVTKAIFLFPKFISWIAYLISVAAYYTWLGVTALAASVDATIGWMMANWALALIIIVIALVVAAVVWMSDSFADAIGMIVGGIMTAIAFVWNLVVGVINSIVQVLWTRFIEPSLAGIEFWINAFNGGFDSFGDAIKNLFGNIISNFLSLGKIATTVIDAIFGTNWTDGLKKLQKNLQSWGKNDKAITINREAPALKRWAYSDAYQTGYEWGEIGANWITGKVSALLDPNDPAYDLNLTDTNNLLKNIEDDTEGINDSLKLKDEDLEYLRKIAEMEWRNEFTTAEIKVDMTNHNQVNSDRDLDGIVEYLSDVLREEMASVAYGVHY